MNRTDARKKQPIKPGGTNVNASRKSSHSFGRSSIRTVGASSRSNLFASTSRKSVVISSSQPEKAQAKPPVQVFDDMGVDVTPRSLLHTDPAAVKRNQSNTLFDANASIVTPSEVGQSFYAASNASMYGGFSRSVFGSSVSGRSSPESISEDLTEPSNYHDKFSSGLGDIQTHTTFMKEEITEADLDKMVHLTLTETETMWLLDIPGTYVSEDNENAPEIKERNQKYEELLKTRAGNDMYVERGMQTFNDAPKSKEVQTSKLELFDMGCMATTWDMYDTYTSDETTTKEEKPETEEKLESLSRPVSGEKGSSHEDSESGSVRPSSASSSIAGSRASMFTFKTSSLDDEPSGEKDNEKNAEEIAEEMKDRILESESMAKNLFLMERVISQNVYQPRQAQYRGLEVVPDIDAVTEEEEQSATAKTLAQLGPSLNKLWAYSCNLTKGRNVSCVAWNKKNPDILGVGYGEFSYSNQKGGLACCWSIKNPEYPERVFHLNTGVTALDFSGAHPNLLAVGLYDGTIAIYNIRCTDDSPALDSSESVGKHTSPVWQLQWVDREQGGNGDEHDEILVSISADGRVTKWSIRKGFESADLMKLKRINVTKQKAGGGGSERKSDALISRFAAGFCFDFSPNDANIYLAGTEEGHVHKCSCSYNEQYLESFHGHTGPIYQVKWNPLYPEAFLTCSADWSVRLWHCDRQFPVMSFLSSTKSVNDISWSPDCATLFACVNDRAVEIWDLSLNTLDPVVSFVPVQDCKLTTVLFALNTAMQTILVGDSEGQVTVYQLRGMAPGIDPQASLLSKIMSTAFQVGGSPSKQKDDHDNSDDFD
ncbi:dynein axonemal intermediate chain 4-like isoform X2 [Nematostella vectensis]|uniref:dynein axonemal intermediate chain 4-like isoform X2 n=1 Tax=Nematostella vectensis TaxID=45351 RepID=UPI0020772D34|nr:dynein axonemal intermediate chain 4-like isoform X2 [Nematostella vectensis]